jgi:hypothetical protein
MPSKNLTLRSSYMVYLAFLLVFVVGMLSLAAGQAEILIYRFNPNSGDGYNPASGLAADSAGNLGELCLN